MLKVLGLHNHHSTNVHAVHAYDGHIYFIAQSMWMQLLLFTHCSLHLYLC